jgi:DNA-binding XRE family transcriptional regulator
MSNADMTVASEDVRPSPMEGFADAGSGFDGLGSPIGELAVNAGTLDRDAVDALLALQHRWGTRLGDIMISNGGVHPNAVARLVSAQSGVRYVDLKLDPADPTLASSADLDFYIAHRCMPWRWVKREMVYVAADPLHARAAIAEREERACPVLVASPCDIDRALQARFHDVLSEQATLGLAEEAPESSARQRMSLSQIWTMSILAALVLFFFWQAPGYTVIAVNVALGLCFLSIAALRCLSIFVGLFGARTADELAYDESERIADADLPVYTIMVPLFREAAVLPILADALRKLDYPASKLDIKLIFEEIDVETWEAAKALHLPGNFEFIRVPHSLPLTKPNFRVAFLTVRNLKLSAKKDRPIVMIGEGLGAHLLYVRRRKCLSQRAAAATIGVEASAYNAWEWGKGEPSVAFWPSVIAFLGYDPICGDPRSLSEKLDALQRRTGLTRKAIGDSIGVCWTTLNNWEAGKTKPRGKTFAALEALLTKRLALTQI